MIATYIGPPIASPAMEPNMNEELWRVQLSTGEIRMMNLEALDRAFDEGHIDARVPVLAPGASAWMTLGEAAGLEDEQAPATEQSPSLSPVAIAAPSSAQSQLDARREPESVLDLDLPDNFDELRPRRRGLVIGAIAAVAAAAVMLAVVVARVGGSMPATTEVKAAAAVQAPPPAVAVESLPTAKKEEATTDSKPELSDWQKRMLADADKARADKTKAKKEADKAARPAPKKPKSAPGLLNGGDRFDPLNGAL
jgi:hypothetical protein